jgi:superfamily II DNA or RNA helicase
MINIPTYITLRDQMNIKIVTDDEDRMEMIREEFTEYVDGFRFTPAYRSGRWNGTVSIIRRDGSLPYGLFFDIVRAHKKMFPRADLIVKDEVKEIFAGKAVDYEYDLKLYPYPFQIDCIEKSLKYSKGLVKSSTGSGKSLVIAYILKILLDSGQIKQGIIIVPNKSLVEQFYNDMHEYEMDKAGYTVGKVYQKSKQWDENIVISTWQTLRKYYDKLGQYGCVIGDECHGFKAFQLRKIMAKTSSAKYRLGFTGTLHSGKLDNYNVASFFGPVITDYSSGDLAKEGYVSSCNVKMLNVTYGFSESCDGTYNEVKDMVFQNDYRLHLLRYLINSTDHNVLVLVGKVETEGDFLKDWLADRQVNKEVIFLSGRDDSDVREQWRKEMGKRDNICMIATYGILSTGVNIPSLKYIVLASPFKSKTRVLQSIGRSLRTHSNKDDVGSMIYDICDDAKYLKKHGLIRLRYYDSEKFGVEEISLTEGNDDFERRINAS